MPLHVSLGGARGPEYDGEDLLFFLENSGEVDATPFVLQLAFHRPIAGGRLQCRWPGAELDHLYVPDAEPNLVQVTYFFPGGFPHYDRPEVFAQLAIEQESDGTVADVVIHWSARGGNVVPSQGTATWTAG